MDYSDGATAVVLNAGLLAQRLPQAGVSSLEMKAATHGRALVWLIFLIAVAMLAAAPSLEARAAYWKQTERNRFVAETVAASLSLARDIAAHESVETRWSQSALGRDDSPRLYGNSWHISVGDATTLGRGVINSGMNVKLYCPGAEIGFNREGRPEGGSRQITITSTHDSELFVVDVSVNGAVTVHNTKAGSTPQRHGADMAQANAGAKG